MKKQGKLLLIVPAVFLSAVSTAALAGTLPLAAALIYITASAVTFAVYAWDKRAAQNNRWRTREKTLHILALVGGWPGALAAQKLVHHKSRKTSFQIVFWITAFLNCVVLGLTVSGSVGKLIQRLSFHVIMNR